MSKPHRKSSAPPAQHGYEFGGPLGALGITIGLPLLTYAFAFMCNDISGCPAPSALHPSSLTLDQLKQEVGWPKEGIRGLGSWSVTGWVLVYYLASLTLQTVLPGETPEGVELASGGRLRYRFNAFSSSLVLLAGAGVGTALQGADFVLWTFIWDNYVQLITANLGIAFFLATFVYVRSFQVKAGDKDHRLLAPGGHSGNLLYDWFIGRELNPRVTLPVFGEIDIKVFCEIRPGLFGWVLLDLAFIAHQYKTYGYVSDSILFLTGFQTLYVFDALYMEPAILTTIDIIMDGFGFMLAFGDLAWLPFVYSLQARYLAVYPVNLGLTGIAGILAIQGVGYYIFRGANNEKNRFRTNPKDPKIAHLKYMETASGSKLLVTGWWGTARHINYLGDWIMSWSYCLPTALAGYTIQYSSPAPGTGQSPANGSIFGGEPVKVAVVQGDARGWGMIITYFYVLYFAVLLIHREMRDEEKCAKKYGKDWEEYKKKVPYRILPYVY